MHKNKINRLKNFLKLVEIGPKKINGRYYYGYTDDVVSISNVFIAFSFFAFFLWLFTIEVIWYGFQFF